MLGDDLHVSDAVNQHKFFLRKELGKAFQLHLGVVVHPAFDFVPLVGAIRQPYLEVWHVGVVATLDGEVESSWLIGPLDNAPLFDFVVQESRIVGFPCTTKIPVVQVNSSSKSG